MVPDESTTFTKAELAVITRIAERDGVTVEEAATRLGQEALARRVKKRTGKTAARVYPMRKR